MSELSDALDDLKQGNFSKLDPLFESGEIVEWVDIGFLDPDQMAEALTCACFNGRVDVAKALLKRGVDPSGGNGTGLNAIHWAANRGQLEAVRLLLKHRGPLETRNMYGGTVLGAAKWALENEKKPDHPKIIQELIAAGGREE